MAKAKARGLTDPEIATLLETKVRSAVGYYDTVLSKERTETFDYYEGRKPEKFHRGNSSYVSQDVYDSVDSMRAALLETFSGNSRPVQFAAQNEKDYKLSRVATEYCTYVVFRSNPGYQVFSDVIWDGLMARVGISKVWWEPDEEWDETVHDAPSEDDLLNAMAQLPDDAEISEVEYREDGSVSATVRRLVKRGHIRIASVPPEEFGISPRARSIQSAKVVYHRTRKTESELIAEGYPKAIIEELQGRDDQWLSSEPEVISRHRDTDGGFPLQEEELQHQTRNIMVYEVYARLDVEGSGVARLWRIVMAGGKVLEKEPVSRAPFVAFVPLPVPHRFHGTNFASKVIPTQKARTALTRSIIDHAMITNNPRMTVLRGGVVNPKELMEQRIGGIVNITRPDALGAVPQTGLNPFVFQTIQMLDDDKEETTGISKLSSGLNKDALSKQNSADMVQQMVSLSQQRQKVIARNFAEQFLKELFLLVYQIAIENDDSQTILEVSGEFVPVKPREWESRSQVSVEFALGYGEQDREAQKYMMVYQNLSADPVLGVSFGPQQRYNTARKAIECLGIKDISSHLAPPTPPPPPQPDPLVMAQADALTKQGTAALMRAETERMRMQSEMKLKELDVSMKVADAVADNDRADRELDLQERELNLTAAANDKRAILSP